VSNRLLSVSFLLSLLVAAPIQAQAPSIDQMLSLEWPLDARVSPNGKQVAYVVQETNWEENAFQTNICLAETSSGSNHRLTRSKGSSTHPQWSPDGKRLAFTSDREGNPQIYLLAPGGGEAVQLTRHETGVVRFQWAPDGRSIAFTATDSDSRERQEREEKYGTFEVFESDYTMTHLWRVEVPAELPTRPLDARRLTRGGDFSVGDVSWLAGSEFSWSPDSQRIAFSAARTPAVRDLHTLDIYLLSLADGAVKRIVDSKGPDRNPVWSPDGKQIAYEANPQNDEGSYVAGHHNTRLAVVSPEGGKPRLLTEDFDESPSLLAWGPDGIYFSALQKVAHYLYRLDPERKTVARLGGPNALVNGFVPASYSFTADCKQVAFVYAGANEFPEVCLSALSPFAAKRLSALGKQVNGFRLARREVIQWTSQDGTLIEGVLSKPADWDPSQKYPLLIVIHGGPITLDTTAIVRPVVYPIEQFTAKGALVLQPNYRGSAGYGEKFRSLNVRNLGLGDAADVISGVDHLIAQGLVDRDRVGVMGWSQGGYISAFLATSSARFKAVSVGAGVTDWMTYYVNTDATGFTRDYLQATPWDDPEIYRKTSPISYLKTARTPTLIQQGDRDERVPLANAYELYRGLKDRGVPVKLVVYKGHGHFPFKPREQRALMEQNYDWFSEYLWGER
jgi:dipeptidyl aminopeptidase/acylaminoacyl peptidase